MRGLELEWFEHLPFSKKEAIVFLPTCPVTGQKREWE
jgi:hypothetical protein